MDGPAEINLFIALIGGVLSFLSPCVLPVLPGYLMFITGFSFEDFTENQVTERVWRRAMLHSLFFIFGFSFIFVALGLGITALGSLVSDYLDIIRRVGAVIIIVLGLHLSGLIPVTALYREKRINLMDKPAGLVGSFAVGVAFAAGWTPCIGPILASILILAGTNNNLAFSFLLLSLYAFGLGLPFLLSALLFNRFLLFFQRSRRWLRFVGPVSGVFLVIMGFLLFFNLLGRLVPV